MELIDREAVREFIKSYRHSTDVAFDMEKHLDEIPAAPRWVRCDDEMPKGQKPVLVFVPPHEDYDDYYYGYVGMAYFTDSADGGVWCGTDGNVYGAIVIIHNPIAWMPLPEPPKEEA